MHPKCMQVNVREYRRSNPKWIIQRNWQHRAHKTQGENQQNKNTTHGHHFIQTNTIVRLTLITQFRIEFLVKELETLTMQTTKLDSQKGHTAKCC